MQPEKSAAAAERCMEGAGGKEPVREDWKEQEEGERNEYAVLLGTQEKSVSDRRMYC